MRENSSRSLQFTVADDGSVSEDNLGRQPFYRCDPSNKKARTLVERIDLARGLNWKGVHGHAPEAVGLYGFDLLIIYVDTASTRLLISVSMKSGRSFPQYWMDVGNRATAGESLIGTPATVARCPEQRLPPVLEAFADLTDDSIVEDNAPSCSVAEALEQQSLLVSPVVASQALALLFDLLGRGSIVHAGAFIKLTSGQVVPIALPRIQTEADAA